MADSRIDASDKQSPPPPTTTQVADALASNAQLNEMDLVGNLLYGDDWPAKRTAMVKYATAKTGAESANPADLTAQAAQVIIDGINKRLPKHSPDESLTTPVVVKQDNLELEAYVDSKNHYDQGA